jgi:hypothetical protein
MQNIELRLQAFRMIRRKGSVFYFRKITHCYDRIDVMGTQVFGSEI